MARETIWLCDVDKQADETVRTYKVHTNGDGWEIDLCDKHAAPILKLVQKGRPVAGTGKGRDQSKTLQSMVRGLPE